MARGEEWATTAKKAFAACGGEASFVEILKWTQENRPNLRDGWQANILYVLEAHSDGKGRGLFESVQGSDGRYRLADWPGTWPASRTIVEGRAPSLAKLVERALSSADGRPLTAAELYFLAYAWHEFGDHQTSLDLLQRAAARGISGELAYKAARLTDLCRLKQEPTQ